MTGLLVWLGWDHTKLILRGRPRPSADTDRASRLTDRRTSLAPKRHLTQPPHLRLHVLALVERNPPRHPHRLARLTIRQPRVRVQARARRVRPRPHARLPARDDPVLAPRVAARGERLD